MTKIYNDLLSAAYWTVDSSLLDLTAAFDTVDHELLLLRLERQFGLFGIVLQRFFCLAGLSVFCTVVPCRLLFTLCAWYRNWVSSRLFILYSADLADIAKKHGVTTHSFTYDTQLYLHGVRDDTSRITVILEHCIADINHWMSANRLKLNTNKMGGYRELLVSV